MHTLPVFSKTVRGFLENIQLNGPGWGGRMRAEGVGGGGGGEGREGGGR